MIIVFTIWYGTARVVTDFLRVDRRYIGLTGSQISAGLAVVACVYLLARYRGAPPNWARAPVEHSEPTAESDERVPKGPDPGPGGDVP
jgi:prolipoprotein diacylglyceryltransferase